MQLKRLACAGFMALLAPSPATLAAPVKSPTKLPVSGEEINAAKVYLHSDVEAKEFVAFIGTLDVFPDHENPADALDVKKPKKFYIAPLFQPSSTRDSIGTQEVADWGIKHLESINDLTSSFDLNLFYLRDIEVEIKTKKGVLSQVELKGAASTDPAAKESLAAHAQRIRAEIVALEGKRNQMLTSGINVLSSVEQGLRESVRNQVLIGFSQLGISPTAEEQGNLSSSEPAKMAIGIAQISARAANGQFGVRQAIFESGYTEKQKRFVTAYKIVRPDVTVASLPTAVTYVIGVAQSAAGNSASIDDVVPSVVMYRGVNLGSKGKCGNTYTCNVVVEYAHMGARTIALSMSGTVMFPVIFESDATFVAPEFEGTVECEFKNGWRAKGRADVKDGAIIYDGDVYNKIHYSSENDGGCNYNISKGTDSTAAYHTIKRIYDLFDGLYYQRVLKSERDKAAYEKFVRDEINRHAQASKGGKGGMFDELSTWTSAFGGGWGTVASFAVGEARNFYWHTRIEDTSSIDYVKYKTTIKESNIQVTERFTYDGVPRVCWKRGNFQDAYLSACPDVIEYTEKTDNDIGKSESNCLGMSFDTCRETVENAPVNEDGVIVDPGIAW